jgi:hypothetical protein
VTKLKYDKNKQVRKLLQRLEAERIERRAIAEAERGLHRSNAKWTIGDTVFVVLVLVFCGLSWFGILGGLEMLFDRLRP